jgi:hypothetical protein
MSRFSDLFESSSSEKTSEDVNSEIIHDRKDNTPIRKSVNTSKKKK